MNKLLKKNNIRVVLYFICGIIIAFSSFYIIINYRHATFLKEKIIVQKEDLYFEKFQNNIIQMESCAIKNKSIRLALDLLKRDGVYRLLPKDELSYNDLYQLNNYFLNHLINDGWVSDLKNNKTYNTPLINEFMNSLINNANYLNGELLNNSNYQYLFKKNSNYDKLREEYNLLLSNYYHYSSIVLSGCGGN